MFRSDAHAQEINVEAAIDVLNIEVVSEIEKELQKSPYDIISLVFLLYDVPDTALQRLIVFQRVSGDASSTNLNLIREWAQGAKMKATWKHEFVESLLICQLYGIVNKLGLHIPSLKKHFQPQNLHVNMYINPVKKALYQVCENIDFNNLIKLKRTLFNCKMDVMEFDNCEMIFLKLMSKKFITISQTQYDKRIIGSEYNINKLIQILEKFSTLEHLANELKSMQTGNHQEPVAAATPITTSKQFTSPSDREPSKAVSENHITHHDLADVFQMLNDLQINDEEHLKSDAKYKVLEEDKYSIKSKSCLGICLIINQEEFYLSERSINDDSITTILPNRKGSTADKMMLEKTMSALNFKVIIGENLNCTDMINLLKNTIRDEVKNTHSAFMLCLLSHGVREHVFAADCVKVNMDDIKGILDSKEATVLRGMPKIMIIQACQVDNTPQLNLVADSPYGNKRNYTDEQYYVQRSDFLVYWATAPQFEAYRDEKVGSIFIQLLCRAIQKRGKREHLHAIFTMVNRAVKLLCEEKKCQQMPQIVSSLSKNLYLYKT